MILGIETNELKETFGYDRNEAILHNQDFSNNMFDYWGEFGK